MLIAHFRERNIFRWPDAGIADEEVQASKLGQGRADQNARSDTGRNVSRDCNASHAAGPTVFGNAFRIGAARIEADHYIGSSARQHSRGRSANAARSSGNERALPSQVDQPFHGFHAEKNNAQHS